MALYLIMQCSFHLFCPPKRWLGITMSELCDQMPNGEVRHCFCHREIRLRNNVRQLLIRVSPTQRCTNGQRGLSIAGNAAQLASVHMQGISIAESCRDPERWKYHSLKSCCLTARFTFTSSVKQMCNQAYSNPDSSVTHYISMTTYPVNIMLLNGWIWTLKNVSTHLK